MKKTFLCLFMTFTTVCIWAQNDSGLEEFIPTSSPEAKSFSEVSFLPVSEYTGKVNIEVPLYEIQLGGLTIPIKLKYNYGGVKVNSIASNVGTNWSLDYGGAVVREKYGEWYVNGNYNETFNPLVGGGAFISRQQHPDVYHVMAPGLATAFVPYKISTTDYDQGKEIENQGNEIDLNITSFASGLQIIRQINSVDVLSTNGYSYKFGNINKTKSKSRSIQVAENGAFTSGHLANDWNIRNDNRTSYDITEIKDVKTGETVDFEYGFESVDFNFGFPNDDVYANYLSRKDVFRRNGTLKTINQTYVADQKDRIERIVFTNGTVEFFYGFPRIDVYKRGLLNANNAAAITRILVKNDRNEVIKDIRLEYSHRQSVENCTDYECYRLFLDRIYYVGDDGISTVPGYEFDYNTTPLPKRYSYKQDFLGFYNGATATGSVTSPIPNDGPLYIPITYQKPNSGRYSYLPIDIGDPGYQQILGNYSLAANETYAKAGILEKVTHPTGGYTIFEAESNQFKFEGATISGGGLRVASQKIYDFDNSLQRQIDFDYTLVGGGTSGLISFMPKFNDYVISNTSDGKGFGIYQTDMANQKLTQASYVGYSRVEVSEPNNGYTVKEFSNLEQHPNVLATWQLDVNGGYVNPDIYIPNDIINEATANGCFPNLVTDRDILRGRLLQEHLISKTNDTVQTTINTYEHKNFETHTVEGGYAFWPDFEDDNPVARLNEQADFYIERNLIKTSLKTSYHANGTLTPDYSEFTYDPTYPFLKKQIKFASDKDHLITKYYYPYETPDFDLSLIPKGAICVGEVEISNVLDELVNRNMISTPYYEQSFRGNQLVSNTLTVYKQFPKLDFNGNPLPTFVFEGTPAKHRNITQKNPIFSSTNPLAQGVLNNCTYSKAGTNHIVYQYEAEGNPVEVSRNDYDPHTILVWGYFGKQLIAKLDNASFENITSSNLQKINSAIGWSNTENSAAVEANIRNEFLNMVANSPFFIGAELTVYTYDPLIGMTSVTDSRGRIVFYEYDEFNRLIYTKDHDGKVLSETRFNYKN